MRKSKVLNLKKYIEEKYSTKVEQAYEGFMVPGAIIVLYGKTEKAVEKRISNFVKMADTAWNNKDALLSLSKKSLDKQTPDQLEILEVEISLAKQLKREPKVEVYERGFEDTIHFVVANDVYMDACL